MFYPVERPWGQEQGGQQGGGNTVSLWNISPLMWGPEPSWRLSICAEVATGWEVWKLIGTKQDSKGSPSKDTVNKGRCFVQPLPFSLMDLVMEGHSILFGFLSLRHLLLFLGKFTLWRRFKQIHLRALVSWQGGVDNS